MGIPKYFRWITTKHPEIISESFNEKVDIFDNASEATLIDNLFLDANGLIHPCCQEILTKNYNLINDHNNEYKSNKNDIINDINKVSLLESLMFKECVKQILFINNYVQPKNLLYIAIDGVAPRAKMEQQRTRRYRSYKEKQMKDVVSQKYNKDVDYYWDTNAITPGTTFMLKLSNYLQKELKQIFDNSSIDVVLSDTSVPGEGEHKIIEYIRSHGPDDICCIYGLDADLIMLSLCLKNRIFLLREAINFGKIDSAKLLYLSIQLFKEKLYHEILQKIDTTNIEFDIDESVIIDYVFICFLLGNDFIPHIVNLDIAENGIDALFNTYIKLLQIRKHYLIENNQIQYGFLQQLLNQLYNAEDNILINIQENIDRKVARRKYKYSSDYDREIDMIRFYPLINKNNTLKLGSSDWRNTYYSYYFNVNSVIKSQDYISDICKIYIEGLQWNIKYYLEGCCSWKWFYPFRAAPCLRELCQYLNNRIYNCEFTETTPYTPLQQLMLVIPNHSKNLLPLKYAELLDDDDINQFYPDDFVLDNLNKTWLHECNPIIPILNDDIILNKCSNISLDNIETKRNTLTNNIIYINRQSNNITLTIS